MHPGSIEIDPKEREWKGKLKADARGVGCRGFALRSMAVPIPHGCPCTYPTRAPSDFQFFLRTKVSPDRQGVNWSTRLRLSVADLTHDLVQLIPSPQDPRILSTNPTSHCAMLPRRIACDRFASFDCILGSDRLSSMEYSSSESKSLTNK